MTTLTMRRGKTSSFVMTITSAAGAVFDLTGHDLAFTAKRELFDSDDDAVFSKTTGDGIEAVVEANGTARVTIDPDDTRTLDVDTVYWDVVVDPDGEAPRNALSGRLVIKSSVLLGS